MIQVKRSLLCFQVPVMFLSETSRKKSKFFRKNVDIRLNSVRDEFYFGRWGLSFLHFFRGFT